MPAGGEITLLLEQWKGGDRNAADHLFQALMPQLHRIAAACFARERGGHTLQPTALVNEAFLRLSAARNVEWRDRAHFLALASRVIRRYLIDHARSRSLAEFLPVDNLPEGALLRERPQEVVSVLDVLLEELALSSPRQKSVVDVKFFLGFTDTEGAAALDMSLHTFQREWYRARKWLFERLTN
jgi:RNA polymerase sigma-70 factor, ECF subfamily